MVFFECSVYCPVIVFELYVITCVFTLWGFNSATKTPLVTALQANKLPGGAGGAPIGQHDESTARGEKGRWQAR